MFLFERNVEVDRLARELASTRTPGEEVHDLVTLA